MTRAVRQGFATAGGLRSLVEVARRPVVLEEFPVWLRPALTRARLGTVSALALAIAMVTGYRAWHVQQQTEALIRQRTTLLTQVPPAPVVQESSTVDFAMELPVVAPVTEVVAELHRSAVEHKVSVQDVQINRVPASRTQLGQAELDVQMTGAYPALKDVIRDTVGRGRYVSVRRLNLKVLQRVPGMAPTLQGDVAIILWERPLLGPTSGAKAD